MTRDLRIRMLVALGRALWVLLSTLFKAIYRIFAR